LTIRETVEGCTPDFAASSLSVIGIGALSLTALQ
jgi:hypothetical protein